MFNRQLVLVATDHGTDVERTMHVALSTAKARGADVHVIQVVPHRPCISTTAPLYRLSNPRDRGVNIEARLASMRGPPGMTGARTKRHVARRA